MAAASRPLPHTLPPLSFFRCRWVGGGVAVGLRRAGRSGVEDDGVVERGGRALPSAVFVAVCRTLLTSSAGCAHSSAGERTKETKARPQGLAVPFPQRALPPSERKAFRKELAPPRSPPVFIQLSAG